VGDLAAQHGGVRGIEGAGDGGGTKLGHGGPRLWARAIAGSVATTQSRSWMASVTQIASPLRFSQRRF
ncbi:MAG TPA: hypothetical protein VME47_22265, partial [Acetobacteraceae bacterium]|nr:hypothetical protein [Acetobacteraceae bacterium]